ncbi:hypothetical protein AKJ09_06813 [Labilithrix luteola]|uniref:Uncharacterized protein n=1 Tax=Labilithrix luteola TaxID=1391654 RepID=A0A0K1Q438_9BACT|nr:hypothetical protein [Labilithrix luteola]AKV00150.1 hypothetical protein AKJ09_06813 [Labilithrix luteola]
MKDGLQRFVRLGWFGLASMVLSSSFVACESDSTSPLQTSPDAASSEYPAPANNSSSAQDAASDAIADAADASADAGKDAFVAVHADVTTDFSTLANPNGAWTYGYSLGDPRAADAGPLVVFSAVSDAAPDTRSWYDPANSVLGAPAAWRNDSTATNNGVAPGEFSLHPGNAGEYAIVRWTAPAAGAYAVTLQFKAGDSGETNGLLLHNGVALVTEDSTSTDAVHELEVTLAAGDHLDAAVGSAGDFHFDNTPVQLTIRSAGSDP